MRKQGIMATPPVRLSEAIEAHLALRQVRVAPSTYADEARTLRWLIRHTRDIQARNLTPEHVESFCAGLLRPHPDLSGAIRPPMSPAAFNLVLARLRPFFKYLVRRGLTRHDHLEGVRPLRVPRKIQPQAGPDRLLALVEGTEDPRDRILLALAANTGLRSHSLVALRVGDVDLAAGRLTGYNRKARREVSLPITGDLDAELRRWMTTYAETIGRPLSGDDYLVPTRIGPRITWVQGPDGKKVRSHTAPSFNPAVGIQGSTARIVKPHLARVGLPTDGTGLHLVRRSAARILFDQLADMGHDGALRVVAALLDHDDLRVTQAYIGVSADRRTLDEVMRGRSLLRPQGDNVRSLRAI